MDKFQSYLTRRIDKEEEFKNLLEFPKYIEIETVNACNARCPMCTINDWERNYPVMKDDVWNKVSDDIIENKNHVKRVSLYRDGEPLIDKKMAARIKKLYENGIKNTSIATNVSLLNEKRATEILEAGLGMVIFSIDSLKKEVFEKIRVRLKFEQVRDNAIRFLQLRDKINPECRVWIRMIRQESNYNEWDSYYDFWRKYTSDVDRIYYHNIFNWGGQLDQFKSISKSFEPNLPCVALWSLLVVFANGEVENRLFTPPIGQTPSALREAANFLNAIVEGRTLLELHTVVRHEVQKRRREVDDIAHTLVESGMAVWEERGEVNERLIVRGRANLLENDAQEEDIERVKTLFDDLERKQDIANFLELTEQGEGVRIFIGSENKLFSLSGSTLVISPYMNSDNKIIGAVGVIGPTRLNYGRIVPIVDYTAYLIGRTISRRSG